MKKTVLAFVVLMFLLFSAAAQDALDKSIDFVQDAELFFRKNKECPQGYKLIYIKCGNDMKPNCIVPNRQTECDQCWEVHWGPCAGKNYGGMSSYNSFERANRVAYLRASTSYCPWFESSNYMIVQNDPKRCIYEPTGYEMISWPSPLQLQTDRVPEDISPFLPQENKQSSGNIRRQSSSISSQSSEGIDGLLEDLLTDNGLATDEKWVKEHNQIKTQSNTLVSQQEAEQKSSPLAAQNPVGLRGLAGKIQSGEYDPYANPQKESRQASTQAGTSSAGNGSSAHSGAMAQTGTGQDKEECVVIIWVGQAAYGWGTTVTLNGRKFMAEKHAGNSYAINADAEIYLEQLGSAPACNEMQSYNDQVRASRVVYSKCNFIRTKVISGSVNQWTALVSEPYGKSRRLSGSFTAKPGCNVIEIK